MQVPAGFLVDRLELEVALRAAFVWWSVANAGIALAANQCHCWCCGCCSARARRFLYRRFQSCWPPRFRREQEPRNANGILDSGYKFGPAVGVLFGGFFLARHGWRTLFVVTGIGGLIWLVPWFWIADWVGNQRNVPVPRQLIGRHGAGGKPSRSFVGAPDTQLLPRLGHFHRKFLRWVCLVSNVVVDAYLPGHRASHESGLRMGALGSSLFAVTGITSIASGLVTDRMLRAKVGPREGTPGIHGHRPRVQHVLGPSWIRGHRTRRHGICSWPLLRMVCSPAIYGRSRNRSPDLPTSDARRECKWSVTSAAWRPPL